MRAVAIFLAVSFSVVSTSASAQEASQADRPQVPWGSSPPGAQVAAPPAVGPPLQVAAEPTPPPPPGSPPPPARPRPPSGYDADGLRLTGGRAFTEGIRDGFFGRVETEHLWVGSRERASGVGGVTLGIEGWGSPQGGGGGLPFSFWGGFHSPVLTSAVGLGWEWAHYDDVRHDGGFGIFAPMAVASMGLDFASVRILADGRAQYRWNWGAEDRWQLTLGVSVAVYGLSP